MDGGYKLVSGLIYYDASFIFESSYIASYTKLANTQQIVLKARNKESAMHIK